MEMCGNAVEIFHFPYLLSFDLKEKNAKLNILYTAINRGDEK